MSCRCGFGEPYEACCGRYHAGLAEPPTALLLMRARFTAFALGDPEFLLRTWHSDTRPARLVLPAGRDWTSLRIVRQTGGGIFQASGTVEFRAGYLDAGRPGEQHEDSRFARQDGQWRYLNAR